MEYPVSFLESVLTLSLENTDKDKWELMNKVSSVNLDVPKKQRRLELFKHLFYACLCENDFLPDGSIKIDRAKIIGNISINQAHLPIP